MNPPDRRKPPELITITVEVPVDGVEAVRRFAQMLLRKAREDYETGLAAEPGQVTHIEAWKRKKTDEPGSV